MMSTTNHGSMANKLKIFLRKIYYLFPCVKVIMAHHVTNEITQNESCTISKNKFENFVSKRFFTSIASLQHKGIYSKNKGTYILTVDDGLDTLYTEIYPVMKRYAMPFTAFISYDLIDKPGYITCEQLQEMASDPLVTIGSHGCSHLHLTQCNEKTVLHELCDSKLGLEKIIGKEVELLAYPFGNVGMREIRLARMAGYRMGFGVIPRQTNMFCLFGNNRFCIPRYNLSNQTDNPA